MYTNQFDLNRTYVPGDIVLYTNTLDRHWTVLIITLQEYNDYWVPKGFSYKHSTEGMLCGKVIKCNMTTDADKINNIYNFYGTSIQFLRKNIHEFNDPKYQSLYE